MKNVTLLFVLIVIAIPSLAQTQDWRIGLEFGGSQTLFWGNPVVRQNTSPSSGYTAGLKVNYSFSDYFAVETGFNLEKKRFRSNTRLTNVIHSTYAFQYLAIPILFSYQLDKAVGKMHYFVIGGPYYGQLLSSIYTNEFSSDSVVSTNRTADFKAQDFGVHVAFKLHRDLAQQLGVSLELRNSLGLYNISALPIARDKALRTNAFSVVLGVWYTLRSE